MRIIALDLGTHCGHAWTDDGQVHAHQCGVWDLSPRRHEGAGMRFVRFNRYLIELAGVEDEKRVYYEEVASHKGTAAAHIYGGLVSILQTFAEQRHIPYAGVPVGTIKKHATGKGNANKTAMATAATQKLGYAGDSDDEADALWLLHYAISLDVPEAG